MSYTKKREKTTPTAADEQKLTQFLSDFFENWKPEEVKEELWNMFIASIGASNSSSMTAIQRSNIASLYKQLTKLIDLISF